MRVPSGLPIIVSCISGRALHAINDFALLPSSASGLHMQLFQTTTQRSPLLCLSQRLPLSPYQKLLQPVVSYQLLLRFSTSITLPPSGRPSVSFRHCGLLCCLWCTTCCTSYCLVLRRPLRSAWRHQQRMHLPCTGQIFTEYHSLHDLR